MKPFFVYMLRCRNGSYYVGHTDDLETRIAQHVDGTYGGHTSRQRPVSFVWCAECGSRDEALTREWQLKKWTRAKKEALVGENWSQLKELARGPNRTERLGRSGLMPVRSARPAASVRPEPFDSGASRLGSGQAESRGATLACAAGSPFDSGPGCLMDSGSVRGLVRPGPYAQGERGAVLPGAPAVGVRPDGEREAVLPGAPAVGVRPDGEDVDA
ncbi:GIY-YIG nuclease family protein [Anaeromyxobacter oryzae]|uniref:GIY-YIG nuclease family protein n=1 Tax=Anaeromyxobacter oryzae TaxID=2918170 RepID=UPI0020BD81F5|nr:GIY-YIG nuclease family protein [Anaeromyxobacter oryzae]